MDEYFQLQLETRRIRARSKVNSGRFGTIRPGFSPDENGFKCSHCRSFVSAEPVLSGVNNRNHCPYCLWSKHLDLYKAGDRLAACKTLMKPVGVALKHSGKKYGSYSRGELLLVHLCVECSKVSLNRIAADDDIDKIWVIYTDSCQSNEKKPNYPAETADLLLNQEAGQLVHAQLYGKG